MSKFIDQFENTRTFILKRARAVSAYFSMGGGETPDAADQERRLAWTSDEQKKRAKEFRELAQKLAKEEKRAA